MKQLEKQPRHRNVAAAAALLLALVSPARAADEVMVDLTHPFNARTIYWPTESGFALERGVAGVTERGYFYAANRFAAPEHGGTHIDAPYHFAAGGKTVDQIPLDRLVGEGACVDVSAMCQTDPDYQVTVEDLRAWEKSAGVTLSGKIVLLRTGWSSYWPDRRKYLGTDAVGRAAVSQLHFPGLDPAAAEWLATRRRIKAVGIDTASIDHGPSRDFASHVNLFKHNVPALENVAKLDQLRPTGFRLIALPMMIAEGTGAPCRVIAVATE